MFAFIERATSNWDFANSDLAFGVNEFDKLTLNKLSGEELKKVLHAFIHYHYYQKRNSWFKFVIFPKDVELFITSWYDSNVELNFNNSYYKLLKLIQTPEKVRFMSRLHVFKGQIEFSGTEIVSAANKLKFGHRRNPFNKVYDAIYPMDYIVNKDYRIKLPATTIQYGARFDFYLTYGVNGIPRHRGL